MNREWLTSPYGFLIFICLGYLANSTAVAVADAWTLVRWLKRRRSRPVPATGTPAAMIQRHTVRTPQTPRGPHMPDENEITRRVGNPDYGPRHVEPPPTLHSVSPQPGPTRPSPDRRGLVAGGLAFLITLLVAAGVAGAYFLGHRSSASSAPKATNVAASPSSTYDDATVQACKSAGIVRRRSIVPDPEAQAARAAAASSDQAALREIAQKYDHPEAYKKPIDNVYALTAATEIEAWCLYHKLDTAN